MPNLSDKAILTTLSISQWSARKFDKRETQELALRHGTATEVARVNKSLLPSSDELDKVHKYTNAVRWDFYDRTLPWAQEGMWIIRADAYMDFAAKMRDHMYLWRQMVGDFVTVYPQLVQDARVKLNGLYKDDDYPGPDDMARRFGIDIAFTPVPSADDWRIQLADYEMEELRQQVMKQVHAGEGMAMKDAWRKVYEVVSKAEERLSKPDAVFRDSLVENAKDLCKILPSLNLTDDPNLERMRQTIEGSLCGYSADTLRTFPDVRADAADKLKEIMDKMGAFYTAPA